MEQVTKEEAYYAGYNCGQEGANTDNCHFSYFATIELCREWERGKNDAEYPSPKPKTKAQVIRMDIAPNGDVYVAE